MKEDAMEEKTLCHLLEEQVDRTPDAIALTFQNVRVSYRDLNEKVNQLAHYLREKGIGPETLVGISTERSIDMVLGLLAILKAGGAYVPLDPNYPKDRTSFMLEDTKAHLLITQSALIHNFLEYKGHIIKIDEDWDKISKKVKTNPLPLATLKNLAYIIYTSGSTGQPKGVMIEHGSLANFLMSLSFETEINNQDKLLAVTTPSFDIAGLEIYLPLIVGAQVVIARKEAISNGEELVELMNAEQISIMQATPSTWQMVIEAGWDGSKNIRALSGGEALSENLAAHLFKKCKKLWNVYGPTETTIWSTIAPISKIDKKITIGKQIANTQVYILDKYLTPVPQGEIGEIYIGGIGVAREYLNRPELTKERFISNPFAKKKSKEDRLYRTGDLGKYDENGNIEFLGRIDNQVKIRGYRIELDEIEAIIKMHPMIKEVAVVPKENKDGEKFLTAYFSSYKTSPSNKEENTASWANIYDEVYTNSEKINDPTFNASGWRDSYSGNLIPETEIRELVNSTVEKVLSLRPKNILEVGCGTGLLLFPLASRCKEYCGTDISLQGIAYIENIIKSHLPLKNISLYPKAADKIGELSDKNFDTIVINSVIQYFPNLEYLTDIIEKSIKLIKGVGSIFIGDIRNFDLLEIFHASKCLRLFPDNITQEMFQEKLLKSMASEDQLLISPSFFIQLKSKFSQIKHVEIEPRRGIYKNELVLFRYNATLYINESLPTKEVEWIDWNQDWSLEKIEELLRSHKPEILAIRKILNKRLTKLIEEVEIINSLQKNQSIKSIYNLLRLKRSSSVDPEEIYKLSNKLNYDCEISWNNSYKDGSYDLVLRSHNQSRQFLINFEKAISTHDKKAVIYANQPLIKDNEENIVYSIKRTINKHLPSYMFPYNFIELEKFPYLPNGKIDRKALLDFKDNPTRTLTEEYVAPRTKIEKFLVDIWSEVLNISNLGANDNFFQIGGDSIRCVQIVTKLRTKGIKVSVNDIFSNPTITSLAQRIQINFSKTDSDLDLSKKKKTQDVVKEDKQTINHHSIYPEKACSLSPFQYTVIDFLKHNPHSKAYFNQVIFEIIGQVNEKLLKKSWDYAMKNYPILRTRFVCDKDDMPVQRVQDKVKLPWIDQDWSVLDDLEVLNSLNNFIYQDREKGFDTSRPPLWRLNFIRLPRNRYYIIWTFHNLLLDGWSMSQIREDIAIFYDLLRENQPLSAPHSTTYIKYINWLNEQNIDKARIFWEEYLEGINLSPNFNVLPLAQSTRSSENYLFYDFKISSEKTSRLMALAQQYKVTLNALIQGVWTLFLNYYTGKKDIIYGITVSGRSIDLEEADKMVGVLINTIPVRIKFSSDEKIYSIFEKIHQINPVLHHYSYVPLKTIQDWVKHITTASNNHLFFDSEFVFNNLPESQYRSNGEITIESSFEYEKTPTPIMINVYPYNELSFRFNYYEKYFNSKMIVEMEKYFRNLLTLIGHSHDLKIEDLKELMGSKEYKTVV